MSITASNFLDGQLIKGNLSIIPGECIGDGLGQLEVLGGIFTNTINQFNSNNTVGVTIENSNFYNGNLITTGITTGNINFTGNLYQNNSLYISSQWSGTNGSSLYYGSTGSVFVGIGTSNPGFTLDVNGNLNFNGLLYQNGVPYISNVSNNNTSQWTGTNGNNLYYGSTGSVFVGIGTTNPIFNLDVNGSINFNNGLYENGVPYVNSQWTGTNGNLIFFGTTANFFVGIGTSNPGYTLDVQGNVFINNTISSSNSTTGGLLTNGGISINNTTDATSFTSGGGLTISGGASIDQTLYARFFVNNNSTIQNAFINNLTVSSLLSQNFNTVNITTETINANLGFTGGSLFITGSSILNDITSNNVLSNNITTETINANLGFTGGSLFITGSSILNNVTSNNVLVTGLISSSNLYSTTATLPNLITTNITTSNIYGTNADFTSATISSLHVNNLTSDCISSGCLHISDESILNGGITTSSLFVSGASILNETTIASLFVSNSSILNQVTAESLLINQNVLSMGTGPSYNSTSGAFVLFNGGLSINSTENAANISSGGGLTNAGGLSVAKDVYIGGTSNFYNNVNLYDGTLLSIHSTALATSLSNGGTFITYGGATIAGNLIVGLGIDANNHYITNVATPIYPGDGVNKQYVDDLFHNCNFYGTNYDDLFEKTKIISTQTSDLLTELSYDGNLTTAFIVYVYVRIVGLTMGLYIIKGFYNGVTWIINTQSIGNYTNTSFSIVTDINGVGTVSCYNPLVLDPIYIKYRKYYELNLTDLNLLSVTLTNNVNSPIDVPGLNFVNANTVGFKCAVIIKTPTKSALFLLTGLQKNGFWVVSYYFFGDPDTQVALSILSQPTFGQIQYTNANVMGTVTVQAQNIILLGGQANLTLLANTNVFTPIPEITLNINQTSNFSLTVYVEVNGLYAIMEINCLVIFDDYIVNTLFSGDNTNVTFRIINGVLNYKNLNNTNGIIKYDINLAPHVDPLCIGKGGTGRTDLLPFSLLRGNGGDPIITTDDLIYKDFTLTLGNMSKILLNNTEDVMGSNGGTIITNGGVNISKSVYIGDSLMVDSGTLVLNSTVNSTGLTSGTLVNYGGASIKKDLYVGGDVYVGGHKVNVNLDVEQTFSAGNGIFTPQSITNFIFNNAVVRYFTAMVSVCKTDIFGTYSTGYDIKGIQANSGWVLSSTDLGDNTGINFSIDSFGQMMYTSNSVGNWISTIIKFKMLSLSF